MKKLFLEIESKRNNIKKVEDLMLEANKMCGLSDDEYGKMMIAVTEIAMNAIIHGNNEDISKKVKVNVECEQDTVKIIITDEGEGFDIEHLPDPTTAENILDAHGRGIFIAKAMVEEFDYKHVEGKGTEFVMLVRKKNN
jgi:serine/threonine-protein kinase RsbW